MGNYIKYAENLNHYVQIIPKDQMESLIEGEEEVIYGILRRTNRREILLHPGVKVIRKKVDLNSIKIEGGNYKFVNGFYQNNFMIIPKKDIDDLCRFEISFKRLYHIPLKYIPGLEVTL